MESLLDTLDIRWYWKEEMVLLLHTTGFSHVQMVTDTHLAVAGEQFVFKAWK